MMQKRSTEGCSKFKSPETRQVQERDKVGQDQVSGGVSVLCWHALVLYQLELVYVQGPYSRENWFIS